MANHVLSTQSSRCLIFLAKKKAKQNKMSSFLQCASVGACSHSHKQVERLASAAGHFPPSAACS